MDEVDIENEEDRNELESRLYAQIHHAATEVPNVEITQTQSVSDQQVFNATSSSNDKYGEIDQNYETSLTTKRIFSRRYWASGEATGKQQQQEKNQLQQHQPNTNKRNFVCNPFKTLTNQHKSDPPSVNSNKSQNHQHSQQTKQSDNNDNIVLNITKTNYHSNTTTNSNKNKSTSEKTATTENFPQKTSFSSSTSNDNKKSKNKKIDNQSAKQKAPAEKSNMKLNPVAKWMQRNKNQNNNNKQKNNNDKIFKNPAATNKQGPFAQQHQKLQKAKRLEEKKQKSKKAKNTAAANKVKSTEIINLDTDSESDSSDVIILPTESPPTYTVSDSGDEDKDDGGKVSAIIAQEENALDSTDVQMSKDSSFIKPQALTAAEVSEKRLENSSRCTSPCSIQSSDDFIGQHDRSRLLTGSICIADDEDLLVLSRDINSLLEVPETTTKQVHNPADESLEKEENLLDSNMQQVPEKNLQTNDSLEFATPTTSHQSSRPKDYRVDQGQFRALDVYESESDITDSVYCKGATNSTIIRQIDTSDEVEDIGSCSQRTKRLRKRRASSSNKESDPNMGNSASSTDNNEHDENDDSNDVLRTAIPFIFKGPAMEHSKLRKRSRTLSSCTPIKHHKRKTNKTSASVGHMSDTEFIATLNNLAQCPEQELDTDDDSETENFPTARDIAEKVLCHRNDEKEKDDEIAVPDYVLKDLSDIFETIDQLDKDEEKSPPLPPNNDEIFIEEISEEENIIYKSAPFDEDVQIIKRASTPKTHDENGSPIYNVVFVRGQRQPGGIGWSEEMRRFYNNSWNGERFDVKKILQKMNPDKNLWKICAEDHFNIKSNKRHTNVKCLNCCEFGHMRSKCKKPKKSLICYMCGESGHQEPRCPNTICLRCGTKTQVFTRSCNTCTYQNRLLCPICKIRGHSIDYCPDKWRRYHSTTEANAHPNSNITYNQRKYCCICGGRGHLSDNCRDALRFSEYPTILSTVKFHHKSYSDVVSKTSPNDIPVNLMYDPCKKYEFDLAERTTSDKYYGRFLKAVNLDHLLKRKRFKSATTTATSETTANRISKKNKASKIGTANQKSGQSMVNTPNQVQEVTESSNTIEQERNQTVDKQMNVAGGDSDVEIIGSIMQDDEISNNQLNTSPERSSETENHDENFKSPERITPTPVTTSRKKQTEPAHLLDSDSNYSFSEHYDVAASAAFEAPKATPDTPNLKIQEERENSRPKPREMETLPDFIPLIDSTEDQNEENNYTDNSTVGVSHRFVADETDDEKEPEVPCEAKIYLSHSNTKYLLSPTGNEFLVKTSEAHNLKAHLNFTSVGHVLVIFGLPSNQDKFQEELLAKYCELSNENNQKQLQNNFNVPKRVDALIKFLREHINQLMNKLGNPNQWLSRLKILERQQSKSGYKLAEKARRFLNMILLGQAGLLDGTLHLDKLVVILKSLISDYNSEAAVPPQLRSEITDHWKLIFSPYRHENYELLVNNYYKLESKNLILKMNIDPILLGQKVLDTSLTEEQKQILEQPRAPTVTNTATTSTEAAKQIVPNPCNQKCTKSLKRKQNTAPICPSTACGTNISNSPTPNKTKKSNSGTDSPTMRGDNTSATNTNKTKTSNNNRKNACYTLLTQISADKHNATKDTVGYPSTFWSRESSRYLDSCIRIAGHKPKVIEKLQRVQNKSKNGQLSYNDYLAVIKLHSELKSQYDSSLCKQNK